jgi:hypothetical protein
MGPASRGNVARARPSAAFALALLFMLVGGGTASRASPPDLTPVPAVLGLTQALEERQIVALGEIHGSSEEHELVVALLRDLIAGDKPPAVVVEFGSGRYQAVMAAYLSGEPVPLSQVRAAWEQTTQRGTAVWLDPIYADFFRTIRELNAGLARERQIVVYLGDPPIDWSKIRNCPSKGVPGRRCLDYWLGRRDRYFASRTIQAFRTGRQVLMIAGNAHFAHERTPAPSADTVTLVERGTGASVFVVWPFGGFPAARALETQIEAWPHGSLARMTSSTLASLTMAQLFGPPPPDRRALGRQRFGDRYDAVLRL